MSLGDYLRLLRARRGGVTPVEISAATGLSPGLYRQLEQRYRSLGSDEDLRRLAEYFDVPLEDLSWRQAWPRKGLSRDLVAAFRTGRPITLHLWTGRTFAGRVLWWDLGAVGLATSDGEVVVQRHATERWELAEQ
jgi:transcriptional regulator with XRE-family HTH domain